MSKSGEIVEISGIYKCSVCNNEVTCVKGERFPPCCKGATFKLVRATRQCRQLIFAQIAIHLICTAAKNDDVFLAYLVAMPRQRFSSRNAFSTKCRRL